jgi:hypothetical protein
MCAHMQHVAACRWVMMFQDKLEDVCLTFLVQCLVSRLQLDWHQHQHRTSDSSTAGFARKITPAKLDISAQLRYVPQVEQLFMRNQQGWAVLKISNSPYYNAQHTNVLEQTGPPGLESSTANTATAGASW